MVTQIDPISTPPTPADTPADFEQKASQVWGDLFKAVPKMNLQAQEIEAIGQAAVAAGQSAQAGSDAALGYRNEANAARNAAQGSAVAAGQFSADAGAQRSAAEAASGVAGSAAGRAEAAAATAESVVGNAVQRTSITGAALLPEGSNATRPGNDLVTGPIPDGALLVRGNTQDPADYKAEIWDRFAGAWKAFADRVWTAQQISDAFNYSQTLVNQHIEDTVASLKTWVSSQISAAVGSVYVYPNGGTPAAPANVALHSRYVNANPFPGKAVHCQVQLQIGGVWAGAGGFVYSPGGGGSDLGWGILSRQYGDTIVTQTGNAALLAASHLDGNPFGLTANATTSFPCRILVTQAKG